MGLGPGTQAQRFLVHPLDIFSHAFRALLILLLTHSLLTFPCVCAICSWLLGVVLNTIWEVFGRVWGRVFGRYSGVFGGLRRITLDGQLFRYIIVYSRASLLKRDIGFED